MLLQPFNDRGLSLVVAPGFLVTIAGVIVEKLFVGREIRCRVGFGQLSENRQNIRGFRSARLLRAEDDPLRFTSVSDWDDDASRNAWKQSPGYREGVQSVKELCDEFLGGDYDVAAVFTARASDRS